MVFRSIFLEILVAFIKTMLVPKDTKGLHLEARKLLFFATFSLTLLPKLGEFTFDTLLML